MNNTSELMVFLYRLEEAQPYDGSFSVKKHRPSRRSAGPPHRKPFAALPNHYEKIFGSVRICAYI